MASKDQDVIYVAIESGWVVLPDGTEFLFQKGKTMVRRDHPVMKACPVNFAVLDASAGVYEKP